MKGHDSNWDSYLSKTTSRRELNNVYFSSRSGNGAIGNFFIRASAAIEKPFSIIFRSSSSSRRFSTSNKSWKSSKSFTSSDAVERVDLSGISSDETFVIGGVRPSKFSRFWKKFKALFKDDKPRVRYNSKNQFSIKSSPVSSAAYARQRKRELADSIDLSEIAKTIETGKIK